MVAIGGDSAMDAAKGVSLHATNSGSFLNLDYRKEPRQPGLPVVAMPTTAATGIDALTHALESLMSRNAYPYADGLALQVVRMVADWLPITVENGAYVEARS